jgi:hypothetical protein
MIPDSQNWPIKPQDIKIFDTTGIPEPWATEFYNLTNVAFAAYLTKSKLKNQPLAPIDDKAMIVRLFLLNYVVRHKFNSNHKLPDSLPTPRGDKHTFDSQGILWLSVLNLCEASFEINPCEYKNAAEWFRKTFVEGIFSTPKIPLSAKGRKEKAIDKLQKENKAFRILDNPLREEESPHSCRLIEFLLPRIGRKSGDCDSHLANLWIDFRKARTQWVKTLQGDKTLKGDRYRTLTADDTGKVYIQLPSKGPGRSGKKPLK